MSNDPLRHAALVEAAKALEPFADYAKRVDDSAHELNPIGDCCPPVGADFNSSSATPLPTIGHCRAAAVARAALLAELAREPWTREAPVKLPLQQAKCSPDLICDATGWLFAKALPPEGSDHATIAGRKAAFDAASERAAFIVAAVNACYGPILCPAAPIPPPAACGGKAGEECV